LVLKMWRQEDLVHLQDGSPRPRDMRVVEIIESFKAK